MIRFWYDESERKLLIIHEPSGKQKEMKFGCKELGKFLVAHKVTLNDCKEVQFDADRLGLFNRLRFWCRWWKVK